MPSAGQGADALLSWTEASLEKPFAAAFIGPRQYYGCHPPRSDDVLDFLGFFAFLRACRSGFAKGPSNQRLKKFRASAEMPLLLRRRETG